MERALNVEILTDALGTHTSGALPAVEDLTRLIANVEIQAFQQNFDISEDLLQAAWYLHGVASAAEAVQRYSLTRQRRAFAVSAHIFDLALNDSDVRRYDRLTYAFAAQVGYRGADLDPNATAVYRRLVPLLSGDDDVVQHIDTLALQAGVAFLGLDPPRLNPLLHAWRRKLNVLAARLGLDDLRTTMFGPAQQVVLAASSLLTFLRRGDRSQLDVARIALNSVIDMSAGRGDHDARWVAAHLLRIADGLETASVWSVLPPGTPPAVAQAFTVGTPPVLTLWPPQRDLLTRGARNPLDPDTKRLLLSVPTSAGKTLLAQVMICTHLATRPGDVCYVTPLRSLGREMRQALNSRLRILNRELGTDLPDFGSSTLDDLFVDATRGDVEVMTPERLMQLLRRDPQGVLERFSLFVVDEAHLLAQPGRGFLLEALVAFLATGDARLVLLSGVLGNAGAVADWLAPGDVDVLFTSDWRGPRRMHGLLYASPVWEQQTEKPRRSATHPTTVEVPLVGKLRVRPAESRVVDLTVTNDDSGALGTLVLRRSVTGALSRAQGEGTPFYRVVSSCASALLHAGSLLMIVSQRDRARDAAVALAEELPLSDATRDLAAFLAERLGAEHPLIACVQHGVGFHHAGLPVDVLDAIEEALRTDQLVAMVATSTLTDGVNLPVRTVVIAETTYEGQHAGMRLDAPRLLNAVGRAGRAGKETEGWIVLALQKSEEIRDFQQLTPTTLALEAHSTLLADDALDALADAEALAAETADAVLRMPAGPAAEFATYVWFVLTVLERVSALPHAPDMLTAIKQLLGFQQMDAALRDRWLALAERVRQTYDATDPERRQRWTAAGTSLSTAARLESLVDRLTSAVEAEAPAPGAGAVDPVELALGRSIELFAATGIFDDLLELPEAGRAWRFRTRRGGGQSLHVPVGTALGAWLNGTDVAALAQLMLPQVPDGSWRLEQAVDAVSGAFEHFFSWMAGVLVEQVNGRLADAGAAVRLPHNLAWLIRYGVDTQQALTLLTEGIRSRRLAYRLGTVAAERGWSVPELREWLIELHIAGWRARFAASPREVLDLLEFTRARRQSLLRSLLEWGHADVDVRLIAEGRISETVPQPIALRPAHDPPAELEVLIDDAVVGVIDASRHADVEAVMASGLDIRTTLTGTLLTFESLDD